MSAYYNEIDEGAAAWLRELVSQGLIAPGDVDERSITEVSADDLRGYDQCHFFAGIGGWSYAARLAGWPDDRPIWTGSPPCQPFSSAGQRKGKADERHLWPAFFALIRECRPAILAGEQVASAIGHGWLDDLSDDLEAEGYAVGAVVLPACGVGAPHIRQRLYWVGHSISEGPQGYGRPGRLNGTSGREGEERRCAETGVVGGLAYDPITGRDGRGEHATLERLERFRAFGGVAVPDCGRRQISRLSVRRGGQNETTVGEQRADQGDRWPGPANGYWRNVDWLFCRDGKWRPVEPGTQPLAHGVSARVGRLRGYGNAIVPQVAAEVLRAIT